MKIFKIILVIMLLALPYRLLATDLKCDAILNNDPNSSSEATLKLVGDFAFISTQGILFDMKKKHNNHNLYIVAFTDQDLYAIFNRQKKELKIKKISTKKTGSTIKFINCIDLDEDLD